MTTVVLDGVLGPLYTYGIIPAKKCRAQASCSNNRKPDRHQPNALIGQASTATGVALRLHTPTRFSSVYANDVRGRAADKHFHGKTASPSNRARISANVGTIPRPTMT
jgi:hypothetical protein